MAWGQTRFKTGVNAWDFAKFGQGGYGAADIFAASAEGASPFQLRQLYHRAGELGLPRENPATQQLRAGTFNREDPDRPGTWVRPCLLYTSPSPRDRQKSRMPSSA